MPLKNDSVAQLVEQLTLNQWVEGSSPSGVTTMPSTCRSKSVGAFFDLMGYSFHLSPFFSFLLNGFTCEKTLLDSPAALNLSI